MSSNVITSVSHNKSNHESEINFAIEYINSNSVQEVIRGLNILTKKSYALLDNPGTTMYLDSYPQLIISIGSLLDTVNPMGQFIFDNITLDPNYNQILHDTYQPWYINYELNPLHKSDIKAYAYYLDDNQILTSILNIIRNFSFEVMNEYILSTNATILKHLVSLLIMSMETNTIYQSTYLCIEILINIASKIDLSISNRIKRFPCFYVMENTLNLDNINKRLLKFRLYNSYSQASSEQYQIITSVLMVFISNIIVHNLYNDKFMTLKSLELLSKLSQNIDNLNYLSIAPMIVYESLCCLLCANITLAEPLVSDLYRISGDPAGRSRLPPSIILANNNNTTITSSNSNKHMNVISSFPSGSTINTMIPPDSQQLAAATATTLIQPITFNGISIHSMSTSDINHNTRNTNITSNTNNTSSIRVSTSNNDISNIPVTIVNPTMNISTNKINTTSNNTVQASSMIELSEIELRDQALDTIHTMCSGSVPICVRLLSVPRILDILSRISSSITSLGGSNSIAFNKDSPIDFVPGPIRANQIIGFLLSQKEGISLFLSKKADLLVAASSEDILADIVCNKALPVQIATNAAIVASQQYTYDTNLIYNEEATT